MRDLMKTNAALLIVGIATFVLMGAGQSLYGPALPAYSRAFGITIGAAGLLVSAHWVGCAIGVGAMFIWGAKMTPQVVVAIMTLGAGLLATSFSWLVILAGGMLFGAGYGCATVVFNPRMLKAFGPKGPAMVSLLNATFGIGAIGAPLVFVAMNNNPTLTFALCAVFGTLIAVSARPAGRGEAATTKTSDAPFRPHWPILAFGVLAIACEACLIGLGPTALIKAGISETHAAQLLSAFFLAFLAARVLLIFLAHRLPSFTLFTLAVLGAFLAALNAALVAPGPSFVALGFCAGMFFPCEYVTASRKMGDNPLVAPSIIAAGMVGGIVGPLLLAPFLSGMGERGFFWMAAAVTGALSLAALANLRSMNR